MLPSVQPSISQQEAPPDILSLETIVSILRRRWLIITLCSLLGAAAGFYIAAKQGYSFEKSARVILRDGKQKNTSASDLVLSEFGFNSGEVNIANESYVFKSTDLMSRVVEKLKLNISYWKSHDIRKLDLYTATPLTVEFQEINDPCDCELTITPLDQSRCQILYVYKKNGSEKTDPASMEGAFNTPIRLPFSTIIISPTPLFTPETVGTSLIVQRTSILKAANDFLQKLSIMRPDAKESSLIELQIRTSHPKKAEDILNNIIAEYAKQSIAEKQIVASKAQHFLSGRLEILGEELDKADGNILNFRTKNKMIMDSATSMGANYTSLQELEQETFNIHTQLKQISTLVSSLSSRKEKPGMLPVNLGIEDQSIVRQIEQYNTTYLKYNQLKESGGTKNPLVTTRLNNMESMKNTLAASISNYEKALKLKLRDLKDKHEKLDELMISTVSHEQTLTPLLRDRKVKEELYIMLLGKREENALAIATTESGARILEYAFGNDFPAAPKTRLFIAAGGAGGAVLCLFGFIFASALDTKIRSGQDIKKYVSLPILAELPILPRKKQKNGYILHAEERSPMSECLHILRNNVELSVPEKKDSALILLLTSTVPEEGKTFIARNLSVAFGLAGKKVLLLDGDLRKGSVSRQTGRFRETGFSTLLRNKSLDPVKLKEATVPLGQDFPGVDIIPSGPLPPNPVSLLSDSHLNELFNIWKTQYDCIIIDAPPFGLLADSAILAQQADSTIYVICSGKIDKHFISSVQKMAEEGTLPSTTSLVINRVNFKSMPHRYHYYNYDAEK